MRILQVLAGAAFGGAETAFVDTCIALSEAGEQIEVVTRPNPLRVGQLEKAGLKVHELPFGGMWDVFTTHRMRKIIADFEPHVVQSWMSRASQKTPRWNAGDKTPPYLTVSRLGGYYKMKYFKNADYFMTITPDIKRYLQEKGVEEDRIVHINNFAETEQVMRPVKRSSLDTPEDAKVLLSLGRLHQSKAFDTLLRALKEADHENIYLWIAGEGPDREALENLSQELGLSQNVRFLGWRDDRAALFQAADICVFPSRYEPFGTVFVQAWAQRTALITTNSAGPAQYVHDDEDGLMVEIDDVPALSAAITRLCADDDLARRLVSNGFSRYMNEFTKENTMCAYLSFYHDILDRRGLVSIAS